MSIIEKFIFEKNNQFFGILDNPTMVLAPIWTDFLLNIIYLFTELDPRSIQLFLTQVFTESTQCADSVSTLQCPPVMCCVCVMPSRKTHFLVAMHFTKN